MDKRLNLALIVAFCFLGMGSLSAAEEVTVNPAVTNSIATSFSPSLSTNPSAGACKKYAGGALADPIKLRCCMAHGGDVSTEFGCCVAVGGTTQEATPEYKCCVTAGGPANMGTQPYKCCLNHSAPECKECTKDSDCPDLEPDNPCREPLCVPFVFGAGSTAFCSMQSVANCVPPEKSCSDKYSNVAEQRCCKIGYDPIVDYDKWKCCLANVTAGRPHDTPCGGRGCPECPRCPDNGRCPECPGTRPLDCNIFTNSETKACCEKFKDVPALAIAKCMRPADCNNSITIVAEAGATVSLSNFNQCCQAVTNTGTMTDVNISQVCNNITTPGGGTPPPPPTTPAGSSSVAATCSCVPRETTQGTAFAGTPWDCEFQAPSASGPSSLSAAANLSVTTQDPFQVVDSAGGMAKTARLPNTSNKFVVQGPLLTNWSDNPDNVGKVTACTQDAAGSNLACGDCLVATKAQIFGGAGGEGGCSLRRNP